jgi:hypothetical protein
MTMAFTPSTVALLRKIRREQGRPLRSSAADIGIHRDREVSRYTCECHKGMHYTVDGPVRNDDR